MSRTNYNRNRVAWRSYNDSRIRRALEINPNACAVAFHLIPFALNFNMPGYPGYVKDDLPQGGLATYTPTDEAVDTIKKLVPQASGLEKDSLNPQVGEAAIESLLLMGSIGTVAQTMESDYDYWVVIDESKFEERELNALRNKLAAIEQWCAERKIEVHFFLSDIEKTRNNDFGATDKESAGSSQAHLLKEEFYRTVIKAGGKDPMWWLLPPNLSEEDYEEHASRLFLESEIDENEVVDLGNVAPIPTGELFGGLLWQLNKATSNPYKASIKMALMESLIYSNSGDSLLCDTIKRAIQTHPDKTDQADPYLLMFDHIRRYYMRSGNRKATDCLEKCFYLKAMDKPVSQTRDDPSLPYKERTLRAVIRHWKWTPQTLEDMNSYKKWDFEKLVALGSQTHGFMLETYTKIYDGVANQSKEKSYITDQDRTILGRKLFTIYDKRNSAKVEYMQRIMNELKDLEALTFSVDVKQGQKSHWAVYHGDIRMMAAKGIPVKNLLLRKDANPIAIMMWLAQNEIYGRGTFLYYMPNSALPVTLQDLQFALEVIRNFFPVISPGDLKGDDLLRRARVNKLMVVVNFLVPRWKTSVETLHIIYSTSWGESFCYAFPVKQGLQKLIEILGQTAPEFNLNKKRMFHVFAPKGDHDTKLARLVKDFLVKNFKRDSNPPVKKA